MSDYEKQTTEDDWSTLHMNGFAQHELLQVKWSDNNAPPLTIGCVSSLSPLDMMHLSEGSHDATGHRIWMGAKLFVNALGYGSLDSAFLGKTTLELGCGTGLAGIAVLKHDYLACRRVVFTDNDAQVLDLCRTNCEQNLDPSDTRWQLAALAWGAERSIDGEFDTIFATDVLYDVGSLQPLLQTVCQYLSHNGLFVLAHVPRASLYGKVGTGTQLEDYIVAQATPMRLILLKTIRPSDLPLDASNVDMQEAGAGILVFQKLVLP
jgi:SAM-dependent methyltransferase